MRLARIPATTAPATTAPATAAAATMTAVAAMAAMTFAMSGTAHASTAAPATPVVPAAPSANDIAAARAAASGALPTVGRFFASGGRKPQGDARQQAAAATAAPRIDSATVPVYYLSPTFVAGGTATPVAQLSFMATDTVSANGSHASVWTARAGSQGWQVVNIATGSDETMYTAAAAPGGAVFEEPQLGAWYQVLSGRVLPMNDTARASVGGGVSLAGYHALVRARYADKMPGSAYDRAGRAGGFQAQAPNAAASPAGSATNTAPLAAGLVLAAGSVAIGAAAIARRRRQRQARAGQ